MRKFIAMSLVAGAFSIGTSLVAGGVAFASPTGTSAQQWVDNCSSLPHQLGPNCFFSYYDASDTPTYVTYTPTRFKDTISASGNETEVFIGSGVTNTSGTVVVYSANSNPSGGQQTCQSLVDGNTTSNWADTIQPDGSWNLTCNFPKGS